MYEFNEKQKFTQWWIWILLGVITLGCTYGAIQQLVFGIPFGDNPASNEVLIVLSFIPVIILFVFFSLTLETKINTGGVYYRFKPFRLNPKHISWDEIESIQVREYSPLKEYGGWGMRYTFRNGTAYNVSGNKGIQLVLKNGKKILIGTQKAQEVETVLLQLKK